MAVHAARVLALAAGPFNGRVRRGVLARRASTGRLERWATRHRRTDRPLFWLHAPSVGEALMAQAIIRRLREQRPDCQVAFTWFSLSAERILDQVGADVTACLPWDLRGEVRRALEALRPDCIAFVRTEVWPVLMREARERGVALALVNAPLAADSSRLRPLARRLLASAYAALDAVGAVAEEDAERLARLGTVRNRIRVTGDARVDQVMERLERESEVPSIVERLKEDSASAIVAGSTWAADEQRLVPAFAALRSQFSGGLRLILAPHEPTPAHLRRLEAELESANLASVRLQDVEHGEPLQPVVIIDRVGLLADLYRIADVAWVGGGFGDAGLHSILEPAALGVPVVYGPRFGNTVEARAMVDAGCGFVAPDAEAIIERMGTLLKNGTVAGTAAREWVAAKRGGAARNAELLTGLLERDATARKVG